MISLLFLDLYMKCMISIYIIIILILTIILVANPRLNFLHKTKPIIHKVLVFMMRLCCHVRMFTYTTIVYCATFSVALCIFFFFEVEPTASKKFRNEAEHQIFVVLCWSLKLSVGEYRVWGFWTSHLLKPHWDLYFTYCHFTVKRVNVYIFLLIMRWLKM